MGNSQRIIEEYNKTQAIGFAVTTTDATATDVITATNIGDVGATRIRGIYLKCTGDKCYLGLGKDATGTPGNNIIPVWKNAYINLAGTSYDNLTVIRSSTTNVTVEGFVVVN